MLYASYYLPTELKGKWLVLCWLSFLARYQYVVHLAAACRGDGIDMSIYS